MGANQKFIRHSKKQEIEHITMRKINQSKLNQYRHRLIKLVANVYKKLKKDNVRDITVFSKTTKQNFIDNNYNKMKNILGLNAE